MEAARQFREELHALTAEATALMNMANGLGFGEGLRRMLETAKTPEDLKRIREELDRIRQVADDVGKEMADFIDQIEAAGFAIPTELESFFMNLPGNIPDSAIAKLREMLGVIGDMEVPWQKMQEAAEKFGIDLGSLGQKFQGAKLKASATEIINAFEMLTKNGADVGGVLFGMRDEISALVQDAKKFRTEIPAQMRPWIEELLRSGHLVDENGEALQDLGGIRFGPPIVSQFDAILKKIEELIDRFIHLADVIGKVPKLPSDTVGPRPPDEDLLVPFANGGLVTRPTLALLGERGPELVTPLRRYSNPRAVPIPDLSAIGPPRSVPGVSESPDWRVDFRDSIREMREDLKVWLESFSDSMAVTMRDAAMGAV